MKGIDNDQAFPATNEAIYGTTVSSLKTDEEDGLQFTQDLIDCWW